MAVSTARQRRLPAARRRSQLFEVALTTFSQRGYAATTMEEIASAAGVTKPLLYQHFASKRALYLELIDDVTARLVAALTEVAAQETSPRRQVEEGMRVYFEFAFANEAAMRMLYDAPHDEELARGLHSMESAIADFIEPLIAADIDGSHRRLLATALVGMTEGATRHWLSRPRALAASESSGRELAGQLAELCWAGLRGVHRPPGGPGEDENGDCSTTAGSDPSRSRKTTRPESSTSRTPLSR